MSSDHRVPALAQRLGLFAQAGEQGKHLHVFFRDVVLGLQARQRQQVLHDLAHALGLRAHLVEHRGEFRHVFRIE